MGCVYVYVCVSCCPPHRHRQDGTLILQIYHSNSYRGDLLQQLDERVTGQGQDRGEGWGGRESRADFIVVLK